MGISIVVPFYNEEDCLEKCFEQITETFKDSDYELIFVNDGSTDNSEKIILPLIKDNLKIKYISYAENKGYSGAIIEGFKNSKNDFVSFLDADLQFSPKDLIKMYRHAKENKYDFVIGVPIKKKYDKPARKIMSFFYNLYVSMLFGTKLKDTNSLKLMKREYLKNINFVLRYGIIIEIEILLGFKMQGVPINTYPINIYERTSGKSKIFSLKLIYRTITDYAKLWILKNKLIKNG